MTWILVILIMGHDGGGKAIDATIRFHTESLCEMAREAVLDASNRPGRMIVTCVMTDVASKR